MRSQLARINEQLESADSLKRLQLVQDRMDLEAELEAAENKPDLDTLEKDFVAFARAYGERKGITYAAWREVGVDASVLKAAGITRGS